MQTANSTQGTKPRPRQPSMLHMYRIMQGATPKDRKSDRLSNSAPKRLVAFSSRARRPGLLSVGLGGHVPIARRPEDTFGIGWYYAGTSHKIGPLITNQFGPIGDGQGVGDNIYVITHDRCTECVGHFDEPQCAAVCPVDNCCIADPAYPETTEVLLDKAKTLNPDKEIDPAKVWSGVRN